MNLSEELQAKMVDQIKRSHLKIHWDNRDGGVDNDTIAECFNSNDPMLAFDEKLNEWQIYEQVWQIEDAMCKELAADYKDEIIAENPEDFDDETYDEDDVSDKLRDLLIGNFDVSYNLESLLSNDVDVRFVFHSDYDCINSHWFESQGGYTATESYFGDMLKILNLNPQVIKKMLIDKGYKVSGPWKARSDKKALVTYEQFWQELINSSCGANELVFLATLNQYDMIYNSKNKRFRIPKGNYAGIFSSFHGGGSVLGMELQRDFDVEIGKKFDSEYTFISMVIDKGDYSIKRVYGTNSSLFGENASAL